MVQPTISVFIPAYNEERFIGRAIRSILNQEFPRDRYEVIAIDDCSEDRTSYALNLFQDEIRILCNDTRLGLPGSLNRAIKAARGKYFVRLDADDFVTGDYLTILYRFLELNTYMDAVACDYYIVDDSEEVISRKNCMEEPIGCGIMFRADHLVDIGMYDPEFLMHEDRDLRIRFLEKYSIHRVELPLYRYRRHSSNMTNDKQYFEKYTDLLKEKHNGKI